MLLCPSFDVQRTGLLVGIYSLVRPYGYVNLVNDVLLQILLYGDKNFPNNLNRSILELTIRFIHSPCSVVKYSVSSVTSKSVL